MNKPIVVGISGGSGSGKTTIAHKLSEMINTASTSLLSQDSYYKDLSHLTKEQIDRVNFDHPSSLDWELFEKNLCDLIANREIHAPVYDFVEHSRISERLMEPAEIIIVEGHLIFINEKIRSLINIKLFLDADIDIMLIRRLKRDINERGLTIDSVLDQYLSTVRPMFFEYVYPGRQWADVILDKTNDESSLLALINSKVRNMKK